MDLAHVMGLPPKALSLDGTLAVAFGARGQGGKAAAHYESHRLVINMTKLTGAGTLAHEFGHALDHYLGELGQPNAYKGAPQSISGWHDHPRHHEYPAYRFSNLSPRLAKAASGVMEGLLKQAETSADVEARTKKQVTDAERSLKSWVDHRERTVEDIRRKKATARKLTKIDEAIRYWQRRIEALKGSAHLATRAVETEYFKQAKKISGQSGQDGYWARPNELFARAFEAYVFDKLAAEGHHSQYLVQGVEPDRYAANTFRGNPYPTGEERTRIDAAFDKFVSALTANEGKHGLKTKLEGTLEPEPKEVVEDSAEVPQITSEQKLEQLETEMEAVADATQAEQSLADRFAGHLQDGKGFSNILQARKFAKEAGFGDDAKTIEEALELGVVKTARGVVEAGDAPPDTFKALVDLYGRQPKLGTRTSTSMREQAYSTPAPLGYLASRLAHVFPGDKVFEPTAGNGALLLEVSPENAIVNEINPERRANLEAQGFHPSAKDAAQPGLVTGIKFAENGVDVVLANPPFGPVKDENGASHSFDMSSIQPGYRTNEIDHVIALRSLDAMHGKGGRAVLILGGPAKTAVSQEARSDAYNSKAKREFFKVLYDRYNVTDHFGVAGELYERQGAGWSVDVIVIDGAGKSARKLPAVDVPRLYTSWDELGGLLDGHGNDAVRAGEQDGDLARPDAGIEPGQRNGLGDGDAGERGDLGGGSGPLEPEGVRPGSVHGNGEPAGPNTGRGGPGFQPGERGEPPRAGGEPVDFDAAFDAALDDVFGKPAATNGTKPATARAKRTTKQVLKDTVASGAGSADAAMAGLVELFGGGKTVGSGPAFDEATYAKAKPLFVRAAEKFKEFIGNIGELIKRMVAEMQRVYGLTREGLEQMRPHLRRFMDEVSQGAIKLGETEKPAAKKPDIGKAARQDEATDSQAVYVPKSESPGLGTLVPANMRSSIEQSLEHLEQRVGNIDHYVAKELGYAPEDLGRYFGAEQVDALALAIDNLRSGKGFIIGDQTGIGKGRVNAGIIRWAIANDYIPVFVTEKPNLYGDMYRDLTDVGIQDYLGREPKMVMTNSGESIGLDEDGKVRLTSAAPKEHNEMLGTIDGDNFRKKYDVAFTTYNQMQTVKQLETARRLFLRRVAPNSVLIFDESHNAGGQKVQTRGKEDEEAKSTGRAGLARELIQSAGRVFYSSATYAKRPDVMDLYSATDMAMAVANPSQLGDAIAKGGVPMQQAVAAMLAEAGQYIRRERSFAGIRYDTPVVPVDKPQYDGIANSLGAIQDFSKIVKAVTKNISDDLKGDAGGAGSNSSVGEAGASSTNFTAVMHNLVGQMLLAMKVQPAVDEPSRRCGPGRSRSSRSPTRWNRSSRTTRPNWALRSAAWLMPTSRACCTATLRRRARSRSKSLS
jgi:hypothetical protein